MYISLLDGAFFRLLPWWGDFSVETIMRSRWDWKTWPNIRILDCHLWLWLPLPRPIVTFINLKVSQYVCHDPCGRGIRMMRNPIFHDGTVHQDLAWLWLFLVLVALQVCSLQNFLFKKILAPLSIVACTCHVHFRSSIWRTLLLSPLICSSSKVFIMTISLTAKNCPRVDSISFGTRSSYNITSSSSESFVTTSWCIILLQLRKDWKVESVVREKFFLPPASNPSKWWLAVGRVIHIVFPLEVPSLNKNFCNSWINPIVVKSELRSRTHSSIGWSIHPLFRLGTRLSSTSTQERTWSLTRTWWHI